MKSLNEKENLVELNTDYLTVKGDQLALEDRTTGKVYMTTKSQINKLFNDMGYRSLNVVNILKEFAGKIISNVGDLDLVKVYADEDNSTCIVASEQSVQWTEDLFNFLNEKGFSFISTKRYDNCRTWDEHIVKSPNGTYFAIDVDLSAEKVYLYSINYVDDKFLTLKEGSFYIREESSFDDIKSTLLSKINLSTIFNDVPLSVYEYITFLSKLGIVKKSRKAWTITELGEEEILTGSITKIDENIDNINSLSWIKSRTQSSGITFDEMCRILYYKSDTIFVSNFVEFYHSNTNENSDYFLSK